MLISLALVFIGCLSMYYGNSFWAVKYYAITGMTFAVVKVSVYALIGYVTETKEDHSQLMSFIETILWLVSSLCIWFSRCFTMIQTTQTHG